MGQVGRSRRQDWQLAGEFHPGLLVLALYTDDLYTLGDYFSSVSLVEN